MTAGGDRAPAPAGAQTFAPGAGEADPFDAAVAVTAPPVLAEFNRAGVLAAGEVHVARRLAALTGDDDAAAMLAAALAARAPRLGHVCVDLATVRQTVTVDADEPGELAELAWPPPRAWRQRLAASPQVAVGEPADAAGPAPAGDATAGDAPGHDERDRPLRLVGTRVYLDRYWRDERLVARQLHERAGQASDADTGVLADGLSRLFAGDARDRQRLAAATAVLRRFAVVAGGPGTGKTTAVARILALLAEQARAAGQGPPRVALAAPTGKAAARLQQAVTGEAASLEAADDVRRALAGMTASTLHRLLGWQPGPRRFRHHRRNRLPHDTVVVDETSMVSLSLMARLVDAVRPGARLVLVGDPHQLASVEAGAVLGDVVGPAVEGLVLSAGARRALQEVTGAGVAADDPPDGARVGDGVVVLDRVHRYEADSGIAALARAVQRGDDDAVVEVLTAGHRDVAWVDVDVAGAGSHAALAPVRRGLVDAGQRVARAARAGDAAGALEALAGHRLLCAHRRGPYGVGAWNAAIEGWLATDADGPATGEWYVGRPLLVTANDYALGLSNGDTGVAVAGGGDRVVAAFAQGGRVLTVSPARLAAVETTHAMTIHKSQGSQFAAVTVVLPEPASRLLTRELLYTAVTRATDRVTLVGTEAALRRAATARVARASGLRQRLWGAEAP